jgi:predicted NACHT family NTPase
VDVLLKKWDTKRNIERDQVYKKLSLKRKEDLLSQIAWRTFAAGNYFFKQKDIEQQIRAFIENLPGASTDEETLNLDSEAVLKSIEAQHGLFVERARGIYSFSHLTFQEYFTACEIVKTVNSSSLEELATHVTEERWREVFLLTTEMLQPADDLLRLMKQQIDGLLAEDEKSQQFLVWVYKKAKAVYEKAKAVDAPYKLEAIRAFYFNLDLVYDRARLITRNLERDLNPVNILLTLDRDLIRDRDFALAHDLDGDLDSYLFGNSYHNILLDLDCAPDLAFDRDLDLDQSLTVALARSLACTLAFTCNIDLARAPDLDRARTHTLELKLKLEELSAQIPDSGSNWDTRRQWWREQGPVWIEQLRAMMIEHRNIGHDWQLSEAQIQRLQQYYEANRLLVAGLNVAGLNVAGLNVAGLNSDCYVSRAVRKEIEDTLLLPLAEIERWRKV